MSENGHWSYSSVMGAFKSGRNSLSGIKRATIDHVARIKTIADKLKAFPEGKGNMFDNTVIMYFSENGESHHSHGTEGHKTIGNWYTTLLNAHGNPIEHYGDFDVEMERLKLDQKGAIKQLLA